MRRYYIIIILICLSFRLYSQQQNNNIINRKPDFPQITTPNVASFNKFIENPISLYTGTPDISIPICTLKDGMVELPIVLRYNSSGIKLDEEASWVGLGWDLSAGGMITQNIVGAPDQIGTNDYKTLLNKLNINNQVINAYYSPIFTQALYNALDGYLDQSFTSTKIGQLNPDVFYFSFPGGSGKFIIDYRNDDIHILNKETDLKIEQTFTGAKSLKSRNFTITTSTGVKHFFTYKAQLTDSASPNTEQSVTYVLYQSLYPNGETVTYNYKTIPTEKYSLSEYYQYLVPTPNSSSLGSLTNLSSKPSYLDGGILNTSEGQDIFLESIVTRNYTLTFNTENRIDVLNGKKLSSIEIKSNNINSSKSRIFKFEHSYFESETDSNTKHWHTGWNINYATKRLRLDKFYEMNNGQKENLHEFSYNTTRMSRKDSFAADYWGYYNGQIKNESFIPNLKYMLFGELDNSDIRNISNTYISKDKFRANRASDFQSSRAYILEKIHYPTGGYTKFTYEPNTFDLYFIPTVDDVKNNIIYTSPSVEDQNNPNFTSSYVFTLDQRQEITLDIYLSTGLNNWYDMRGHKVQIRKNPGASLIKEYNYDTDCSQNYQKDKDGIGNLSKTEKITLDAGTYILIVDIPESLGDQSGASLKHGAIRAYFTYTKPVTTTESKCAGLRISEISHFDTKASVSESISTKYEYTNPKTNKTSGILHNLISYYNTYKNTAIEVIIGDGYPVNGVENRIVVGGISYIELVGSNTISNPYGSGGGVGYSCVKEVKKGRENESKYSYFYNEKPNYTQNSVRIDKPLNGKLIDIEIKNDKNLIVLKEHYSYTPKEVHCYWGMNITDNLNKFPAVHNGTGGSAKVVPGGILKGPNRYYNTTGWGVRAYIIMHALKAHNITLDSKEVTQDGVTTKETYTYNPQTLQLQKKVVKLDGSNSLTYEYKYPNDMNCTGTNPFALMTNENFIAPVIEERIYRNKQYLGGVFNGYKRVVGLTSTKYQSVPSNTYYSEASASDTIKSESVTYTQSKGLDGSVYPTANVSYHNYDGFGNPIYISHNSSTQTVYLWGYGGQYPIAEIKNATYAEIKTALGVTPESLSTAITPNFSLINGLRDKLPNTHITTYEYQPLVGITKITDPRGVVTTYEYDSFGRLKATYITEGSVKRIIQEYQYNYKNQ